MSFFDMCLCHVTCWVTSEKASFIVFVISVKENMASVREAELKAADRSHGLV